MLLKHYLGSTKLCPSLSPKALWSLVDNCSGEKEVPKLFTDSLISGTKMSWFAIIILNSGPSSPLGRAGGTECISWLGTLFDKWIAEIGHLSNWQNFFIVEFIHWVRAILVENANWSAKTIHQKHYHIPEELQRWVSPSMVWKMPGAIVPTSFPFISWVSHHKRLPVIESEW